MSANTGRDLVKLVTLTASATDLIVKGARPWYQTQALLEALQLYKDGYLGWAERPFSPVDHRRMFFLAMKGYPESYQQLMNSLREFGVGLTAIRRLKDVGAAGKTLQDLYRMPLGEFWELVQDYFQDQAITAAFIRLERKIGIEDPVGVPSGKADEVDRLVKACEAFYPAPDPQDP